MADSALLDAAWKEFSDALDVEMADWKQAVIAGMRQRHGRTRESRLREQGFTGTVKDKLGREVHYVNGKRVKHGQADPKGKKKPATKPTAMDRADALLQKIGVQPVSGAIGDAKAAGAKFMDDLKNLKGDIAQAMAPLHERASAIAQSVLDKTKGIWDKVGEAGSWMKEKTKAVYDKLEQRYGKAAAIGIFAAGHVLGLGTPLALVPGSTLIGMAPFAAMAETYLQAKKLLGPDGMPGISLEKMADMGRRIVDYLAGQWQHKQPAAGQGA